MELSQVFRTPDGETFDTRAEAERHMRAPAIRAALLSATGGQVKLAQALYDSEDDLRDAMDTGTIRRVTKAERNKLAKDLAKAAESMPGSFLAQYQEIIAATFRWPTQQRVAAEEKDATRLKSVADITEDEEAAKWIVENWSRIVDAYNAGKPERKVSPQAQEGLALYRAMKDAQKQVESLKGAGSSAEEIAAAEKAYEQARAAMEARKAARTE